MKRVFALMLALCLTLCACGSKPAETTAPSEPTVPTTAAPETTAPPEATVPPTVETTAPVSVATNPLTGEALDEAVSQRPTAVMINNLNKAAPQCGISKADIVYELIAEGSITRFIALFHDLSDVDVIGPVRSVRPYFLRLAQHYDAILASAGGSEEAYDLIDSLDYDYLNGIAGAGSYFYRDEWRRTNRGYEHSLMTTGEKLLKATEKAGIDTAAKNADYGLTFTDESLTGGEAAAELTIWFYQNGKKTTMSYDADTGLYAMSQHGAASVDANDDSPVVFRNVLVLKSDSHVKDDAGHMDIQTTGTGEGWYARDGRIIPITWSRESNATHYVYTDSQGAPISLGVGKTYVAIVPGSSPFSYQ